MQRPGRESPKAASHGSGLAAAAANSSRGLGGAWGGDRLLLCPLPHEGLGVRAKRPGSLERGKAGNAVPEIPFLTRARRAATVWNASPNMVLEKKSLL